MRWLVLLALCALFPLFGGEYYINLASQIFIFAISLMAGLQTISPALHEAAAIDRNATGREQAPSAGSGASELQVGRERGSGRTVRRGGRCSVLILSIFKQFQGTL